MLQVCTFGEGATRHWRSTGKPNNMNGLGMTLTEYTSHLSVWAILGSPLIHSADLRTVAQRHPECLDLMLNEEILMVGYVHSCYHYFAAQTLAVLALLLFLHPPGRRGATDLISPGKPRRRGTPSQTLVR